MRDVFLKVLELGISASILIGVIILIRQIFKKRVSYSNICLLWLLVGIRLLVPFSLESEFSLIPRFSIADKFGANVVDEENAESMGELSDDNADLSFENNADLSFENDVSGVLENSTENTSGDIADTSNDISVGGVTDKPTDSSKDGWYEDFISNEPNVSDTEHLPIIGGTTSEDGLKNDVSYPAEENAVADVNNEKDADAPKEEKSETTTAKAVDVLVGIWISGTILFLLYGVFGSFINLKRKIMVFSAEENHIRKCESIDFPFVFGFIKPKIYMPFGLSSETEKYIVAHEKTHIKRFDHIFKALSFVALSIYWFCPLVWVWFVLLSKDMEYACDEKVIERLCESERKKYAFALLECSVKKPIISSCPVAFGEIGVKGRVKNTMRNKKTRLGIIIAFVAIALVLAVLFLTNPKDDENSSDAVENSRLTDSSEFSADASRENSANSSADTSDENSSDDESAENSQYTENGNSSDNVSGEMSNGENSIDASFDDISKDVENDTPPANAAFEGKDGDVSWKIENGVLTLEGGKTIPKHTDENPAPWLARKNEITEIIMSDEIKSVGDNAFAGCYNLKKVKFSQNLTGILVGAFKGCSSLENVLFPEKLNVIYNHAFDGCSALTKVHIPQNVTSVASDAFINCKNLKEITVSEKNNALISVDGVLYVKPKTHIYKYPSQKTDVSYEILSGVNYISSYAFYDNDYLESVTLPKSVNEIQECAFGNCENLKKITIMSYLRKIEKNAFAGSGVSEIYYEGTRKEWLKILKEENWYTGDGYTVYCSDGNLISKPENKTLKMWLPFMEGMDYECYLYEFDGTAEDLVAKLVEFGIVQSGTKVNSFKIEGDVAKIDLSKEFTENMLGLTSETNIIESLANTIIDTFGVKKVLFTINGKMLSTGHNTYDFPIGFTRYIKLYVPTSDFSGIETIEAYCNGTVEDIISMLIMYKALPEGTTALSYNYGEMYFTIDFSKEFGDVFFADPDGKGDILYQCVKGTLQSFYKPPLDVYITIEGKDLGYAVNG